MLDGVFAFLQLGDVELRLGAVQPFEPQLIVVDVGDGGAEKTRNRCLTGNIKSLISANNCDRAQKLPV